MKYVGFIIFSFSVVSLFFNQGRDITWPMLFLSINVSIYSVEIDQIYWLAFSFILHISGIIPSSRLFNGLVELGALLLYLMSLNLVKIEGK